MGSLKKQIQAALKLHSMKMHFYDIETRYKNDSIIFISRIFHSKLQFGVELALLRTPPPLLGGREEQVASCRDEKRDDALTVPLRLMQYICC